MIVAVMVGRGREWAMRALFGLVWARALARVGRAPFEGRHYTRAAGVLRPERTMGEGRELRRDAAGSIRAAWRANAAGERRTLTVAPVAACWRARDAAGRRPC